VEHTLSVPELEIMLDSWSYSIRICGDYVGILFMEVFEGSNELVVWSWRTGVRKLVVNIVGIYNTTTLPTHLLSRYYRPTYDPLCFSATNLSWELQRNHLHC
jgi:hypothetical protein